MDSALCLSRIQTVDPKGNLDRRSLFAMVGMLLFYPLCYFLGLAAFLLEWRNTQGVPSFFL